MYIPFFANAIIEQNEAKTNPNINLAGFLIGNGAWILDWDFLGAYQINTYASHQFFNNEITDMWYDGCLTGKEKECDQFINYLMNVGNNTDVYNIYNYTYTYSEEAED
jgi:carboxypeptidase C (cathepsin A)